MTTLLGIIFFHVLVIIRAKISDEESFPIISTIVLTIFLTGYVLLMMFTAEEPIQ